MKVNATWNMKGTMDGQPVSFTFTSDDGATWTALLTLDEAMTLYSELRKLGVAVT